MSTPPAQPAQAVMSPEEWTALYEQAFRASSLLLGWLEAEIGEGLIVNPQVAGTVLLIAMGRLSGRYGYRHLGPEAAWKAWTSSDLAPLFVKVFREERAKED